MLVLFIYLFIHLKLTVTCITNINLFHFLFTDFSGGTFFFYWKRLYKKKLPSTRKLTVKKLKKKVTIGWGYKYIKISVLNKWSRTSQSCMLKGTSIENTPLCLVRSAGVQLFVKNLFSFSFFLWMALFMIYRSDINV